MFRLFSVFSVPMMSSQTRLNCFSFSTRMPSSFWSIHIPNFWLWEVSHVILRRTRYVVLSAHGPHASVYRWVFKCSCIWSCINLVNLSSIVYWMIKCPILNLDSKWSLFEPLSVISALLSSSCFYFIPRSLWRSCSLRGGLSTLQNLCRGHRFFSHADCMNRCLRTTWSKTTYFHKSSLHCLLLL